MNKPTKRFLVAQIDEGTKRINLITQGYNEACADWEFWLKANIETREQPVKREETVKNEDILKKGKSKTIRSTNRTKDRVD